MAYDDWRVNGEWHLCECGRKWSDSDGGPCHVKCPTCDELSDPSEADDNDLCSKCHAESIKEVCEYCGEKYEDYCKCNQSTVAYYEETIEGWKDYCDRLKAEIATLKGSV